MMRRATLLSPLLAAALCAVPGASLRAQQPLPAGYEEGMFELVAGGLPTTTLNVVVTPRGKFLVPLRALLEPLAVPFVIRTDSGLARVTRPAGIGTALLHWSAASRQLVLDPAVSAVPLDSDDVLTRGEEVFVSAPRVAALLEAAVDVDLSTLTIRATRPAMFPAQIRVDVLQRRRDELRRATTAPARTMPAVPFAPRTGFGVVEWAVNGSPTSSLLPSTVESRVGMGLYGGMLKTRGVLALPTEGTGYVPGGGEISYQRVFPEGRWLRQVQLGDVFSQGALARPMRGVLLTNAPFVRATLFGELPFSRPLPPGWEYEVYEGDRLIGYADASSKAPLNVPLQYGTTPLKVRLYGPAGERIESEVSYIIPVEQLPAGDWQYATGAGRCALGQCAGLAYGELRHGVSRRLTVQGGVDEIHDSTTRRIRPYAAASFLPAPEWTASLQLRHQAYTRMSVQKLGDGRVTGGLTAGINAPGEGGISVAPDVDAVWFARSAVNLRRVVPGFTDRSVSVASRIEGRKGGGGGRWDLTATAPVPGGVAEVGLQSDPLSEVPDSIPDRPMLRIAPTLSLGHGPLSWLGSPVLRTEVGLQSSGLTQWDVALSLQPGRAYAHVSLRQLAGTPGVQLALGGSVALGGARLLGRMSSHAGRTEGNYTANGAVAVGSVRRASALEYGGLGLAGIEGRVFLDRDGDGLPGAQDEPARRVTVQVGGLRTETDDEGRYSVWNVIPYEIIVTQLDSLSIEDPGWVSAVGTRTLRPSPQQFTRVDFPLVQTREVVGSIAVAEGMPMPAGVAVELREASTGALYGARTFSDGGFYFSRVRPGRYLLSVTPSSLRALGAGELAPRAVIVGADGSDVVEVPVLLVPAAAPAR